MRCRICSAGTGPAFTREVLRKYDCTYYFCDNCGGLQTEDPYWLDEAYERPVASADTGILVAQLLPSTADVGGPILSLRRRGRFLDAAGGYGIFTRLMRDIGFDYYWSRQVLPQPHRPGLRGGRGSRRALHRSNRFRSDGASPRPGRIRSRITCSTGTDTIIFTTELFAGKLPAPQAWWYYAFPTGQHITFYQRSTLEAHRKALRHALLQLRYVTHVDASKTQSAGLARAHLARLLRDSSTGLPQRALGVSNNGGP